MERFEAVGDWNQETTPRPADICRNASLEEPIRKKACVCASGDFFASAAAAKLPLQLTVYDQLSRRQPDVVPPTGPLKSV